jgi:porphobilinogen synthase
MPFPTERLRRLRRSEGLRRLVAETHLSMDGIIEPLFAAPGKKVRSPVPSMPGCAQMSIDVLVEECQRSFDMGIRSVLLFGIPSHKDAVGSEGYADDGIVCRAIEAVKKATPELVVWADVCMCEYTDHGHCGIIKDADVDNDATLPLLARASVAYANAGADGVAPSDMMDGRVAAIREALDEAGHELVPIMSYACKFASAFYGPFRDAAGSTPQFGDRRSYQMQPGNGREALHEMEVDLDEGADILMVKPGFAYLDIIRQARDRFDVPIAAYNVSGEYAMVKAAGANGWIDEDRVILETMTAFQRAGAGIVLTYFARDLARLLGRTV